MIRSVVVVAVTCVARLAHAEPECEALVEQARAHHEAERYRDALAASRAAYACDPQPRLLFSMGQISFNLGDYPAAEDSYTKFLATNPPEDDAAIALQALAVTRERIAAAKAPKKVIVISKPIPPPPADKLAWTFAIGGSTAALAGGTLYFIARQRAVDTDGRYGDYDARVESARRFRIAAIACGGLGVALGVVAAIRWIPKREPSPERTVLVPLAGHDMIGIGLAGKL
jgi:tetratricopeptide (TPR) repeat protein